jgi:hypothetical protein
MRLSSADPVRNPYPIFQRPACPQCGDMLFAASATEFLGHGKIRNTWSCESCDHEFRTAWALPIEN